MPVVYIGGGASPWLCSCHPQGPQRVWCQHAQHQGHRPHDEATLRSSTGTGGTGAGRPWEAGYCNGQSSPFVSQQGH
eukprot:3803748-Lingulodinium_polyedra.AAC.1